STEVFGILPIPEALREKSGMVQYNESIHRSQTHWYVASCQQTQRPIFPIYTPHEQELFRKLISSHTGSSEPPWEQIVRSWNASANQDSMLSYKLIEHLRLYYNGTWKSVANVKQTYAETAAARKQVKQLIHDERRTQYQPSVLEAPPTLHHVTKGLQEPQLSTLLPNSSAQTVSTIALSPSSSIPAILPTSARLSLTPASRASPGPSRTSLPTSRPPELSASSSTMHTMYQLAAQKIQIAAAIPTAQRNKKNPKRCMKCMQMNCNAQKIQIAAAIPTAQRNKKNPKRCMKCMQMNCNGRQNRKLCISVCGDCRRFDCQGRNSKYPNRRCENL
ncbi:hypothetical protein GYMLUDRAFT_179947, partial [Collybiopsis luxurians FD-317 M1]